MFFKYPEEQHTVPITAFDDHSHFAFTLKRDFSFLSKKEKQTSLCMAADTSGGYHCTDPNAVNSSPPTSPPHLHCRQKSQQLHFKHQQRRRVRSLSFASASRRHLLRYFLLLLLVLYFSGLITCVGPLFAILRGPLPPGSIYRSHEVFEKLWPHIQSDSSSSVTAMEVFTLLCSPTLTL